MIGFFIKKAFFDGWDNFITLIVLNLGYIVLLGLGYVAVPAMEVSWLLAFAVLVLWMFIFQLYSGIVSFFTHEFARYRRPELAAFLEYGKQALRYVPIMTGLSVLILLLYLIVLPFYLSVPGVFSAVAAAVVFWSGLFLLTAMQYYYPAAVQLKNNPVKVFKKTLLICLDNFGFSLFMLLHTLVSGIISVITVFLIPGFTGILLSHQVGMKLRLYKYDYLEEHPGTAKKDIPWDALLFEEREKVGPRSLRGMIFPWKD